MGKLVVLKLGEGDFDRGFPIIIQIGEEGSSVSSQDTGNLPPNSEIPQSYNSWQSTYYGYIRVKLRLDKPTSQTSSFSILDVKQQADNLSKILNQWLKSQQFNHIREELLVKLEPDDEVRFIIETPNIQLRQLPWHLWDLLERYPQAEIALSTPKYSRVTSPKTDKAEVKILAILGNNTNIDINKDRAAIENLPSAKPQFLVKPDRREITNQLWEQPWDIFFFAGHSETDGVTGRIYINDTESLTIGELKYSLRKSIAQGLQIAIFNSCKGLGLAQDLSSLHIPQIIVMREPVSDEVAQEFLKNFLIAFSGGKSFYMSVKEAREQLQGLEDKYPCASWLPVICQNPAAVPPTWEQLRGGTGNTETKLNVNPKIIPALNHPLDELAAEVGESKLNQILAIAQQLGKLPQPTVSSANLISSPPTLSSWQGRDKEIRQVQAWLSDANIKTIGIQGLSGVGKSWLASYLYEQSETRFTAIFWAEVSQLPDFTVFAQNALIKLAGKSPDDLKYLREPSQLIHELLKALKQRSCLLVVDNLETLLDEQRCFLGAYRDFFRFWNERGTPTSKLLLTTQTLPAIMSEQDSWLNLTGLNAHEGAKLLRDLGIQGEEAQLREFVELVGGHPKILRLAASQLKQYKPKPHIREAEKLGLKQIENAIKKLIMPYRDKERVLFVSILEEHFNHLTPELQHFFMNLSIYRLRAFNWEAAAVVLTEGETPADFLDTQAALGELRGRSLLDEVESNSDRRFQFHPFVWQYAKQKAGEQTEALREKVIAYYQSITTGKKTWKILDDVAPYLEIFHYQCDKKSYDLAFNAIDICDNFLNSQGCNTRRQLNIIWKR